MDIFLGLALVLLAGFVPMLVYSTLMWWLDRYEKEPLWLLALVFLWGAVPAVILAGVAQLITGVSLHSVHWDPADTELTLTVVAAPITEEIAKGLAVLLVFLFFRHEIDSLLDGIVYGSLVGFGFAATENVLYFLQALVQGGVPGVLILTVLRAFIFGMCHAFFTALTGVGIAYARHGPTRGGRLLAPLVGLLLAMAFHAMHNLGAVLTSRMHNLNWLGFISVVDWFGVVAMTMLIVVSLNWEKRTLVIELRDEVDAGTIRPDELRVFVSSLRRSASLLGALVRLQLGRFWTLHSYYHAATELAFLKRHLRELKDVAGADRRIEDLRAELAELRRRVAPFSEPPPSPQPLSPADGGEGL